MDLSENEISYLLQLWQMLRGTLKSICQISKVNWSDDLHYILYTLNFPTQCTKLACPAIQFGYAGKKPAAGLIAKSVKPCNFCPWRRPSRIPPPQEQTNLLSSSSSLECSSSSGWNGKITVYVVVFVFLHLTILAGFVLKQVSCICHQINTWDLL